MSSLDQLQPLIAPPVIGFWPPAPGWWLLLLIIPLAGWGLWWLRRFLPAKRPLAQRHQRQRAAFAVIVGAQQQQHVFGGHDDEQRPQDQAEHAEHDGARDRLRGRAGQ